MKTVEIVNLMDIWINAIERCEGLFTAHPFQLHGLFDRLYGSTG